MVERVTPVISSYTTVRTAVTENVSATMDQSESRIGQHYDASYFNNSSIMVCESVLQSKIKRERKKQNDREENVTGLMKIQ